MNYGVNYSNDFISGYDINLASVTVKESKSEITLNSNVELTKSNEKISLDEGETVKFTHLSNEEIPLLEKLGQRVTRDRKSLKVVDRVKKVTIEVATILTGRDTKNFNTGFQKQELRIGKDFSFSVYVLYIKGKLEGGIRVINPTPKNYSVRKRTRESDLKRTGR